MEKVLLNGRELEVDSLDDSLRYNLIHFKGSISTYLGQKSVSEINDAITSNARDDRVNPWYGGRVFAVFPVKKSMRRAS
jgi:hypothetical protein